MLEAHAPGVRPKVHVPDFTRDEGLAVAVPGHNIFAIVHDPVVQVGVRADLETVDGCIPDSDVGPSIGTA